MCSIMIVVHWSITVHAIGDMRTDIIILRCLSCSVSAGFLFNLLKAQNKLAKPLLTQCSTNSIVLGRWNRMK